MHTRMSEAMVSLLAVRAGMHRLPCMSDDENFRIFEQMFKYSPTPDQLKCFRDIENDMVNNTRPMDRLICGDVGFGKTEVAMRAIYRAVVNNRQVAVLAPTRLLASQHAETMSKRFPDIK